MSAIAGGFVGKVSGDADICTGMRASGTVGDSVRVREAADVPGIGAGSVAGTGNPAPSPARRGSASCPADRPPGPGIPRSGPVPRSPEAVWLPRGPVSTPCAAAPTARPVPCRVGPVPCRVRWRRTRCRPRRTGAPAPGRPRARPGRWRGSRGRAAPTCPQQAPSCARPSPTFCGRRRSRSGQARRADAARRPPFAGSPGGRIHRPLCTISSTASDAYS